MNEAIELNDLEMQATEWYDAVRRASAQAATSGAVGFATLVKENIEFWLDSDMAQDWDAVY